MGRKILDGESGTFLSEDLRRREALVWLEIAAENGHVESTFLLAITLFREAEAAAAAASASSTAPASNAEQVLQQIEQAKKAARLAKKMKMKTRRASETGLEKMKMKTRRASETGLASSSSSSPVNEPVGVDVVNRSSSANTSANTNTNTNINNSSNNSLTPQPLGGCGKEIEDRGMALLRKAARKVNTQMYMYTCTRIYAYMH